MDSYSTKKRSEDGICSLTLNASHRLQQRSVSASRLETLKQEQEHVKEWNAKMKEDLVSQTSNVRALQRDLTESRQWGGPQYRHVPPHTGQTGEYKRSIGTLHQKIDEQTSKQEAYEKMRQEDSKNIQKTQPDTSMNNLSDWFKKYGEPNRKAELEERSRTIPLKPRRIPFLGQTSSAKTLRLGAGRARARGKERLLWDTRLAPVRLARSASAMGIVQAASGGKYAPNPKAVYQVMNISSWQEKLPRFHQAEGFDVEKICAEIDPDKIWLTPGQELNAHGATARTDITLKDAHRSVVWKVSQFVSRAGALAFGFYWSLAQVAEPKLRAALEPAPQLAKRFYDNEDELGKEQSISSSCLDWEVAVLELDFAAAERFSGQRHGREPNTLLAASVARDVTCWVYKTDYKGLGYYRDMQARLRVLKVESQESRRGWLGSEALTDLPQWDAATLYSMLLNAGSRAKKATSSPTPAATGCNGGVQVYKPTLAFRLAPTWRVLLLDKTFSEGSNTVLRVAACLASVLGLGIGISRLKTQQAKDNFFAVVAAEAEWNDAIRKAQLLQRGGLVVRVVPGTSSSRSLSSLEGGFGGKVGEPETAGAGAQSGRL
ncbi:unnamed protein product [Polarella glacialis]|uniref:Uncharacterized protein n=1 Tax=Polarella glacialis TaxID=89957 RepID=A0A813KUY8_POLGL|nr:unnamed protein product [Polarella glacialis]